ncbi:hypothetical protein V6N13_064297 [Hibiscus sabdariffa]|uniref:Uncharacterized protein n=1 Tax=Hibiscus sabdariffa TaxID=183260 RepID=A0ABR2E9K9_9ROSI
MLQQLSSSQPRSASSSSTMRLCPTPSSPLGSSAALLYIDVDWALIRCTIFNIVLLRLPTQLDNPPPFHCRMLLAILLLLPPVGILHITTKELHTGNKNCTFLNSSMQMHATTGKVN